MDIYIVIAFISLLYLCIGYLINKKNSKYLLAGYNTMTDDERKKFDIASIMAAQTAQQNQEIIGKLIDWLKSQTLARYFSIVCFNEKQGTKIL